MTIAGFAAAGMDNSKHFVMGGGTTQEFILIVSFAALGLVLISLAVGACTRCRSHACAARYTSPRR